MVKNSAVSCLASSLVARQVNQLTLVFIDKDHIEIQQSRTLHFTAQDQL